MIESKYKTTFFATAHCVVDEEKDKFLAKASFEKLRPLLPKEVDLDENPDLIPFVANGTVVNRGNKNFHLVDTETCLAVADNFKYKFIDIEHRRDIIVGVIADIGYSKFGSDTPLTAEEVKDLKEPFNLVISGYVWRLVKPGFSEKLIDSNNPSSEWYQKISLSWEVAYNDYYLLVGNPNLTEGEVIKDPEEIAKYSKYLRANGGENLTEDGKEVYIVLSEGVVPLGFGFTTSPAAEVKGLLVDEEQPELIAKENKQSETTTIASESINKSNNISQEKQHRVNQLEMKITSTKDISEKWNEIRASEDASLVVNFIEQVEKQLKEASDKWVQEQKAREESTTKLSDLANQNAELAKRLEKFQASLDEANKTLEKMETERIAKEQEASFQDRMIALDSEYELDQETREIIASEIRNLDEAGFDAWLKKFKVLAKEKSKATKADAKKKSDDAIAAATAAASALNNATVTSAAIPNASTQPNESLEQQFKQAFKVENLNVTK